MNDEVKSKICPDITGVVIAKYPGGGNLGNLIDVRLPSDSIYYATPASGWKVIIPNQDGE
jgi:hypothetical protein